MRVYSSIKHSQYKRTTSFLASLLSIFIIFLTCIYSLSLVATNPGEVINSEYDECGPSRYSNRLFFASNRDWLYDNNWDIYVSHLIGDLWTTPEPLTDINTKYCEAGPSITLDGSQLYFHSNREGGFGKEDIYISKKDGNTWSEPKNMGGVINSYYIDATPFITEDGNMLIFSSDRPGGEGGLDIWVSIKTNGEWTKPFNLGERVNTRYNEKYPIFVEGILFWASDYKDLFGYSDIFISQNIGNFSTQKQILFSPINTTRDDFALYIYMETLSGYISSNRDGGLGGTDIWSITLSEVYPDSYKALMRLFN